MKKTVKGFTKSVWYPIWKHNWIMSQKQPKGKTFLKTTRPNILQNPKK